MLIKRSAKPEDRKPLTKEQGSYWKNHMDELKSELGKLEANIPGAAQKMSPLRDPFEAVKSNLMPYRDKPKALGVMPEGAMMSDTNKLPPVSNPLQRPGLPPRTNPPIRAPLPPRSSMLPPRSSIPQKKEKKEKK